MTQTPFTLPITENMAEDTHKAKNPPLEAWGKAGSAESPNVRMKTVDADTLNQEWEYRLEKGFKKKNLYS